MSSSAFPPRPSALQVKLIRNFLMNCAGLGSQEKNNDEDERGMDKFEDSVHLDSSLELVHLVLGRTVHMETDEENLTSKATRLRHQRTIQSSKKAWTTCNKQIQNLDTGGHRGFAFLENALQMIREGKTAADNQRTPYVGRNAPRVKLYANASRSNLNAWLASLTTRQRKPDGTPNKRPNLRQLQYLQRVLDRILHEAAEEEADKINIGTQEPLLDFITGDPGTGKTEILWWLREMFEDQLLWTHGNEFVYLAQQNLMAATIGGNTIHAWGKIPINEAKKKVADAWKLDGRNQMYLRILSHAKICTSLSLANNLYNSFRRSEYKSFRQCKRTLFWRLVATTSCHVHSYFQQSISEETQLESRKRVADILG